MAINKNKVQLQETILDSNGHPLSSTDVNPLTSSDCVIMENGMTLEDVMGNDTVIDTPTIMNEDTSFKVGIGDSETKVIDSDVAKMVIEGKTYQNILPKPTTLIMNTDEKEFKINDKIDNNIVLDDNVAEIATIKGQTYVNVVQEESASEYVAIDEELNGQSITTTGKPEGYVKNATLEGLTLVNTIQEPSGADATVLELDADIDAQYATIDNTVQGGIKSAILTGNTLVNLCKIPSEFVSINSSLISVDLDIAHNLQANKKYAVIGEISEINAPNKGLCTWVTHADDTVSYDNKIVTNNGRFFFTYDVTKEIKTFRLYVHASDRDNGGSITIGNLMVIEYQEGMENWDIPYFEGMTSVKMPVLKTTGKNLFDKEKFIDKNQWSADSNGTYRSISLQLEPNTVYTMTRGSISCTGHGLYVNVSNHRNSSSGSHWWLFHHSGNYNNQTSFTTNETGIIYFNSNTVDLLKDYKDLLNEVQLEKGDTVTSYEPFKSNILTVNEEMELRRIGDIQDELDLTTGELTQRIYEFILDGSQNIENEGDLLYYHSPLRFANNISNSDKLPSITVNQILDGTIGIAPQDRGGRSRVYININGITTKEEMKNYFLNNPITIQCVLIQPTIKTVDLSIVDQDNNPIKSIQTHPTLTHITTSSNGLIPFVTIPSQLKYPTIIKPSTTYTVQLKQTTVNSEFPLTINLGGTVMAVPSTKSTITTPETLTSQDVIFTGKNNVIGEVVITEGDTTGIEYDYFEGMNDVKSPKLLATGKNLFDVRSIDNAVYDGAYHYVKIPIKRNTTYTFSLDKTLSIGYVNIAYRTTPWGGGELHWICHPDTTKKDVITFTNTIYDFLYINWAENNKDLPREEYMGLFRTFQLEEGSTATSYEPYKGVTIEQSIDSIPLTSDMFEQGNILADNIVIGSSYQQIGRKSSTARINAKTLIKVKPNCTYTLQSDNIKMWMMAFDKNGGYIKNMELSNTITTDANTYYLGLKLQYNDDSNITPSTLDSLNLTLQEVTDEIVLRSIGDVKDTLNLTTGEYVQRIGEIVLDGSEAWTINTNFSSTYTVFYTTINEAYDSTISEIFVTDKFKNIKTVNELGTVIGFYIGKAGDNKIAPFISSDKTTTEELRLWLKTNPVKVQYKLATPIIKKVNLTNTTKLPSYTSTTHYDTIVPSNSLIPNIKLPSTIDYNVAIKPSTQYTIRANTTSAMSVDLGGSEGTLANGKVILTTPSTLAHNSLKLGNGKAKEVMVIEGSEIKDNVPFFNGMKNVQMGGIKLVNIARFKNVTALVTANDNKTQFTYTGDGSGWGYVIFDNALLKPNTKYTIYMNVITTTSDSSYPIKITYGHNTKGYLDATQTGIFKKAITTLSEEDGFDRNIFGIAFRPCSSGGQIVIQNPMIIEGDWTHLDEIPFIESEMIIEQPIIRSTSENGVEPFKQHTLSSNRVIGYEENCYHSCNSGAKITNTNANSMLADVEGLTVAYVTNGSSNFAFYDKDMVFISGKPYLDTGLSARDKNGFIAVPSNAKYMRFASGNTSTSSTDYTKATVTGELPLRSLPNGVCDTLNLVTGEYVQRVGEIVLDGSKDNVQHYASAEGLTTSLFLILQDNVKNVTTGQNGSGNCYCDKFIEELAWANSIDIESIWLQESNINNILRFRIKKSKLQTVDNNGIKQYLSQNPITVQYELETPIVRKIGLTAKGNYKEVELNGSENWNCDMNNTNRIQVYISRWQGQKFYDSVPGTVGGVAFNKYRRDDYHFHVFNVGGNYGFTVVIKPNRLYLADDILSKSLSEVATLWKRWLSLNPVKVGYLTTNSASLYSNIQKPIFFNNVNVQFMNNNVDIQPSLTLQTTSRNSYVMDMMKANTVYTLKALANPKSFTIDGTSYNATTNGTFTSPSTLTNKLLITGQDVQELMIIEGDVTGKQLPYFKGIRSSFDNTGKIEIYSNGRNIFDGNVEYGAISAKGIKIDDTALNRHRSVNYMKVKPNTTYTYSCSVGEKSCNWAWYDKDKKIIARPYSQTAISPANAKYLLYFSGIPEGTALEDIKVQIEEGNKVTSYQPYKGYNTTLINMPTQLETVEVVKPKMKNVGISTSTGAEVESTTSVTSDFVPVQPKEFIHVRNGASDRTAYILCYDVNKNFVCYLHGSTQANAYLPENCYFVRINIGKSNCSDLTITRQQYKPIALNELPNGVKDELIINRATSSAKLVRRVGKVVLDGCDYTFGAPAGEVKGNDVMCKYIPYTDGKNGGLCISDRFLTPTYSNEYTNIETIMFGTNTIIMSIRRARTNSTSIEEYLKDNPITVYYELAEPVITEIRLKGYPFIYEDGSITLNTDIAPVTRTSYNVNQHQLINSQNETIIRHDKQISDLYDYIEIYLDEIYHMELFKMQLELSL